jgi:hypothetical protein
MLELAMPRAIMGRLLSEVTSPTAGISLAPQMVVKCTAKVSIMKSPWKRLLKG